jgi:hypothetical protein
MNIKFKDKNTELKMNSILNCISQANERLNKNFSYDDKDLKALSEVFNIPKSDVKIIYDNFIINIF